MNKLLTTLKHKYVPITPALCINGIPEFNVFEITPVSSTFRFISSTNGLGRTSQNIFTFLTLLRSDN